MASLSLSQFLLPPRWNSKLMFSGSVCIVQIPHHKISTGWKLLSSSKGRVVANVAEQDTIEGGNGKRKTQRAKGAASRGRKKALKVDEDENSQVLEKSEQKPKRQRSKATSAEAEEKEEKNEKKTRGRKSKESSDKAEARGNDAAEVNDDEGGIFSANEDGIEKKTRGRKAKKKVDKIDDQGIDGGILSADEDGMEKAEKKSRGRKTKKKVDKIGDQGSDVEVGMYSADEEDMVSKTEKKSRGRRSKKKADVINAQTSDMEASDVEGGLYVADEDFEDETDLELDKDEDEGVRLTYRWPPVVCCFGAAQHAFVPSGRPANRLIDYDIHERLKDALWEPENFVRAPGGSAGSVAIALASLGGRVAFMGKIGDDEYGQSMLYYMNVNNVQTRSVCIDSRRATAVSKMKISKRGSLRMTVVKPCAEDSLTRSEINIDVLKEAKMFYLNTSSLLDQNMRKTTLRALKIAKKLGSVIFYDLNLPLPLWQSHVETRGFIQQVWNLADVIEVTKQELEFLCGIEPSEKFDTKDNHPSKFLHYEPGVIAPLWHENLKLLFVTNGTSKIHYYTKEQNGSVLGMEDPPVTPFTAEMSASGDGIVAAIMRMLAVQPHLVTDKGYIEHTIKYAIDCGVIDQWLLGRRRGFPPFESMEEEAVPDQYGTTSLTEREFRSVARVS